MKKTLDYKSLDDFTFEIFTPSECPLCKEGSKAIKPGSNA